MADHLDPSTSQPDKPAQDEGKKVYRAPKLTKLGDLRDMTMAVSNTSSNADGGSMGTSKTM